MVKHGMEMLKILDFSGVLKTILTPGKIEATSPIGSMYKTYLPTFGRFFLMVNVGQVYIYIHPTCILWVVKQLFTFRKHTFLG